MFDLFHYAFIQHAFIAGSIVAVVAGFVGYFLTTRRLTFAGHALSHIGFAGAAGALLIGLDPITGLLTFTVGAAIGIGIFGKAAQEEDTRIGVTMTFMLALGALFISLYTGYAEAAYSILFGTILGISTTDVVFTITFGVIALAILITLYRPLVFSSIDSEVAEARGVPVRALGVVFLILVAFAVSMSVQIVGVLLIFTLLVGPAATANRMANRPGSAIMLSIGLALSYTWIGILFAAATNWPVSFFIATLSFIIYLAARFYDALT